MSICLSRFARLAFRRRRLVLAAWLVAAIAAIALAQASGGKTNDNFTVPRHRGPGRRQRPLRQAADVQREPGKRLQHKLADGKLEHNDTEGELVAAGTSAQQGQWTP